MSELHSLLHALNEYSNILLVIVTVVYVIVTWRTLTALKQTSLREREARHLQDIKERVASPLTTVIGEFESQLQGQRPIIGIYETASPRQNPELGSDPYERSRHIRETRAYPFDLSEVLYSDAKKYHFSDELSQFEEFRADFCAFAADCASFAEKKAAEATLKARAAEGHIAVNADLLLIEFMSFLMQGLSIPQLDFRQTAPDGREVFGFYDRTNYIARGDQRPVDSWLKASIQCIGASWIEDGLSVRAEQLLRTAKRAQEGIEKIKFTHALWRDCAFIGSASRKA